MNRRRFNFLLSGGSFATGLGIARPSNATQSTRGTDWECWAGPNQDFSVSWPQNLKWQAPNLLWKQELGRGHSAVVSSSDSCFVFHLVGDEEKLEKRSLSDGKKIWESHHRVSYHASTANYDGPHATPAIVGNRIITVGIDAIVRASNTKDGTPIWSCDLKSKLGTQLPQSGYACSPLVWKNLVFVAGLGNATDSETEYFEERSGKSETGKSIAGAAAIDCRTGKIVWRSESFRASHSSPVLMEIENQVMLVFHGMFELVGVDPNSGKILWRQLLRKVAADNVSFTPIWDRKRRQILIAHGYCDHGAQAIQLSKKKGEWKTRIAWTNRQLQIVHTNAVLVGTYLVGTRRPSPTLWTAIDVRNGRTVFRERGFRKSNFLSMGGGKVIILDERGKLIGASIKDGAVVETWQTAVASKQAWTVPTFSGETLLMRDGNQLAALKFAKK